jgi:hypothetical protein
MTDLQRGLEPKQSLKVTSNIIHQRKFQEASGFKVLILLAI